MITTQKLMDTASGYFRVFPNPVSSGTSVNLEWREMGEGYHTIEMIDLSGRKLFSKQVWMDNEARVVNLEIPVAAAGNYLLAVTNMESGRRFTEKITIQ